MFVATYSGTFAAVCLCTLVPCEIDRLSLDNWFSNFIIVLIFFTRRLSMVYNDLSNLRDRLVVLSSQKIQELIYFFSLTTKFSVHFVFKLSGHL